MVRMNRFSMANLCRIISFVVEFIGIVGGICQLPASLQNKTWYMYRGLGGHSNRASMRREMVCSADSVSGMTVTAHGTKVTTWKCYNKENDVWVLRGDAVIDAAGDDAYAYAAFRVNDTALSPMLYPLTSSDSNAFDEYVHIILADTANPTINQIVASTPPADVKYFMFEEGKSAAYYFAPDPAAVVSTTTEATTTQYNTTITKSEGSAFSSVCLIAIGITVCVSLVLIIIVVTVSVIVVRRNKPKRKKQGDYKETLQFDDRGK